MNNLTQDEIDEMQSRTGQIDESDNTFCRYLVKYMMGFMRRPESGEFDFEVTRQDFFRQIKRHLDEKTTK